MSVPVVPTPNDMAPVEGVESSPVFDGDKGSETDGSSPEPRLYTSAEVTSILEKRVDRLVAKHASEKEEWQATVGKTEIEVAAARAEKAELQASMIAKKLNETIVRSSAVEVAYALDVKPEKVESVLRLADLPSVNDEGDIDPKAVKAAIAAIVKENPEWVRVKGSGVPVGAGDRKQVPEIQPAGSISEAVNKWFSK